MEKRAPRRPLLGVGVLLLAGLPPLGLAQDRAKADLPFTVEELAPGGDGAGPVWAALQPMAGRFNDCNSLVVFNASEVLVVDGQAEPLTVESLLGEIGRRTELPVRTLVTTHWHGDHTQGGWAYRRHFGDQLEIIGQASQHEDVLHRARPALEEQLGQYDQALAAAEERMALELGAEGGFETEEQREGFRGRVAAARAKAARLGEIEIPLPSLTFEKELVLRRGSREIRLLALSGHTRGDVVVFLPQEKIVATGDLLDDLPFGGHGYPSRWLQGLHALTELDFEILVPGHGRVRRGDDARAHLALVTEMVRSILDQVAVAIEEGKSQEETREAVDLVRFREALAGDDEVAQRAFENFLPETVDRAYLEAKGELPD